MNNISKQLNQLKSVLESAAFLVCREGAAKDAHSEIIKGIVILSEINSNLGSSVVQFSDDKDAERYEIEKVARRLKLWTKRQDQINSKILNAFIKLKRTGLSNITEEDLKNALLNEKSFATNFAQMKIVSDKNHGKIFHQEGARVSIWKPVVQAVKEYEEIVFE